MWFENLYFTQTWYFSFASVTRTLKKKKKTPFLSPHAPGYLELNRNKTQHQEHQTSETTQTHEGVANGGRESTTL